VLAGGTLESLTASNPACGQTDSRAEAFLRYPDADPRWSLLPVIGADSPAGRIGGTGSSGAATARAGSRVRS